MTTADAILALFITDETVLRPSEILRRTDAKPDTVRMTLQRLVHRGRLFHLCHSQYARSPNAKPVAIFRRGQADQILKRLDELEARIDQLERLVSDAVP